MSARDHFLDEFARVAPALPGRGLAWLDRARREALEAFAATGLPTQHDEEWKYTSLAALDRHRFAVAAQRFALPAVASLPLDLALADAHLLVFVDGRHVPALSRPGALPAGVTLASLADVIGQGGRPAAELEARLAGRGTDASALAALNAAFMTDGAYIELAPGAALDRPIELLSIATSPDLAIHLHHLVLAGEESRCAVVEHYFGMPGTAYAMNTATDIAVGDGARIEHHRLQDESTQAIHLAAIDVRQQRGSLFVSNAFAFGAALARAEIGVTLEDEDANCALNGLYFADGRQHVDHHTRIDHVRPRGTSRELYKGIVGGSARAVFDGKVIVHAGAWKTDAHQSNRNLLLSESAEVDTKPQLEIHADDVKCSHGATVGQLDPGQIFYLRSRGVDMALAKALLAHAFAAEIIDRVGIASLRTRLERRLGERNMELAP